MSVAWKSRRGGPCGRPPVGDEPCPAVEATDSDGDLRPRARPLDTPKPGTSASPLHVRRWRWTSRKHSSRRGRSATGWSVPPARSWIGRPHLLVRTESTSRLGAFAYLPVLVRGRSTPDAADTLVLAYLGRLLERLQGCATEQGEIWLAGGVKPGVPLAPLAGYLEAALAALRRIRDGQGDTRPFVSSVCAGCR